MYTVVLQRTSNLPIKVPIIIMQRVQADILRAKLMIKEKEKAKALSSILPIGIGVSNEMMISVLIMLNYNRNKSVIITDRNALKISTILKK